VNHGWVVAPDVVGGAGDVGRLRSAADATVTEGLSEWWAPAVVGRGHRYAAGIAVSTHAAARRVAEQLGVSTLYWLDDDVDVRIGWDENSYVVTENLFVCDLDGTVRVGLAVPATFHSLGVDAVVLPDHPFR